MKPRGEVDILTGYNYAAWNPIPERSHEHLFVLLNFFGKCIGNRDKNEDISFIVNFLDKYAF